MKREYIQVDKERGIFQLTLPDERWYCKEPREKGEVLEIRPSVTFISETYPKDHRYSRWLQEHGLEASTFAAAKKEEGFLTHRGVAALNAGETINYSTEFADQDGKLRSLTADEYAGAMSYVQWCEDEGQERFQILGYEMLVWPDIHALAAKHHKSAAYFHYGGMLDIHLLEKKTRKTWVVDCKISPAVYPSYEIQVEMYRLGVGADKAAVLLLNVKANKLKKYKFIPTERCTKRYFSLWDIWHHETEGIKPLQRDFPLSLSLAGMGIKSEC